MNELPPTEPTPLTGPVVPLEDVEALRTALADLFVISDTSLDQPYPGYVRFRGRFLQDLTDCFDTLRQRFEIVGYTPKIQREQDRIAILAWPVVFNPATSNWGINLVLLLATIVSTLYVGATFDGLPFDPTILTHWLRGWPFCLSIMLILGAHELGHYFAARYHRVPVTLPYFIPMPIISLFGTMGAFIQLKAPVKNRRALLDVGVAGPLSGLVFALPILFYGLYTSPIGVSTPPYIQEGNSILYLLAKFVIFGKLLPSGGMDVHVNQFAWAGWAGLLVTSLNLIPLGQLDGGHTMYVLLGERAKTFFWPIVISLVALGLLTGTSMWLLWAGLLFMLGRTYAEPLDDITTLDETRRLIAIFTLILFVLTFVPVPLQIVGLP